MKSIHQKAVFAGLMYLLFFIFSFAADYFAVFANGSQDLIMEKMFANQALFTFGLLCNIFSAFFFLMAAWGLFRLLEPLGRDLALLFLLLNLSGVVIQCISLIDLFNVQNILIDKELVPYFTADEIRVQAGLAIKSYQNGFLLSQLFFGTWLLPLGYLVYRSGFFHKAIGILIYLDSAAILLWHLQYFLLPEYKVLSIPGLLLSFLAEASLTVWMLIKGLRGVKK